MLKLKKNEIGLVFICGMMIFLLTSASTMGWFSTSALAAKTLGIGSIPILGLGGRLLFLLTSLIFTAYIDKFKQSNMLVASCIIAGTLLLIARFFIMPDFNKDQEVDWRWITFFSILLICQGCFYNSAMVLISTMTNNIFTPSQGARIFSILGIVQLLGSVAGGALLKLLPFSIGIENFTIVWAFLFFATIPFPLLFQKRYGDNSNVTSLSATAQVKKGKFSQFTSAFQDLYKTPFGRSLIFLPLLVWMITPIEDFQYKQIMNHTFPTTEELSRIFANYLIIINCSAILVQLFVSKKIIEMFGVFRSLIFVPVIFVIGFSSLLISYSFWPSILFNYFSDMTFAIIYFISTQLVFNAIPITNRKKMINFIAGVIRPLGYILGSVIVIVIQQLTKHFDAPTLSTFLIPLSGLILSSLLLYVVLKGRLYYIKTLVENLASDNRKVRLDTIEELEERQEPVAYNTLTSILLNEKAQYDDDTVVKTMEVMGRLGNLKALRILTGYLYNDSPRLRRRAISAIRDLKNLKKHPLALYGIKLELKEIFEHDPYTAVRIEAGRFLIDHTPKEQLPAFIDSLLKNPDSAARVALYRTVGKLNIKFSELVLIKGIQDSNPIIRKETICYMWDMLEYKNQTRKALLNLLQSPHSLDREQGMKAIINVNEIPPYLSIIEKLTKDSDTRVSTLAGLVILFSETISEGEENTIVTSIVEGLATNSYLEAERKEIINLLSLLKEDKLDKILMEAVMLPVEKRKIATQTLGKLKDEMDLTLEMENYLLQNMA